MKKAEFICTVDVFDMVGTKCGTRFSRIKKIFLKLHNQPTAIFSMQTDDNCSTYARKSVTGSG